MIPQTNKRKEAIRIICAAAKDYDRLLNGYNYIFIYKNRTTNQIEYFETVFLGRNFQHLTGVEFIDKHGNQISNATYFYQVSAHGFPLTVSPEPPIFVLDLLRTSTIMFQAPAF